MKRKKYISKVVFSVIVILILLFIVSPMIAVVGASFSDTKYFQFPPASFSLRWYSEAIKNGEHISSLLTSVKIACCTMLVADLICIPACFALTKGSRKLVKKAQTLFMAPLFLPMIALGVGLMLWLAKLGVRGNFWTLVMAHVIVAAPYYIRVVGTCLSEFDYGLVDAANSLGATPVKAFLYVTLPSIAPGIIVASMFGFMLSFSELIITLFISSSGMTTFPVRVYSSMVTEGLNPMILAYSTIIILVVLIISVLAEKFAHWSKYF